LEVYKQLHVILYAETSE